MQFEEVPVFNISSFKYVPWLFLLLSFLFSIFLQIFFSINNNFSSWQQRAENSLTIEIDRPIPDKILEKKLSDIRGIKSIKFSGNDEIMQIAQNFVHDSQLLDGINLPKIIDIEVINKNNLNSIKQKIKKSIKDCQIYEHSIWIDSSKSFFKSIEYLSIFIAIASFLSIMLICIFITRSIILGSRETIYLLELLGSSKTAIGISVGKKVFKVSLLSSIIGFVLSIIAIQILLEIMSKTIVVSMDLHFRIYNYLTIITILIFTCAFCSLISMIAMRMNFKN